MRRNVPASLQIGFMILKKDDVYASQLIKLLIVATAMKDKEIFLPSFIFDPSFLFL